jgi:pyruvate dehydrogenase (quinone)
MSKRVADLLVETLQVAGVKTCYGIVGDTMNRIAHALHHSEIDWVHMRHEEAGAFAASAEALLSAKAMLHGKGHDGWEMLVENIP